MKHLDEPQREALAQGAGEAEAVAHAAACPSCAAAVRDAKARRAMLSGLTGYTLSDMAFRRVEARLLEQVEAGLPSRTPWLAWLVPAALAALVLVVVAPWRTPEAPEVVTLPTPPAPVVVAFEPLTVLRAAAGSQVRQGAAAWQALSAGDVLTAGAAVSSDAVMLAPATGRAWAFEGRGSLAVGNRATIDLGAGVLLAQVAQPASVSAGTRRVEAGEARFSVSRAAAEVVVAVAEGSVDVVDSLTAERRRLTGPRTLRFADGAPLSEGRAEAFTPLTAPVVPPRPWGRFDASGLPVGTRVSLDGVSLGTAPLSALLGAGRHRLGLAPPGQALRESWVDLVGGAPFVAALPERAEVAEGPPPSDEALARVQADLLRQRPRLAACYEKWLKANPTASGTVELSLVVSASGRVKAARVVGGTLPRVSMDCLVRTARGLTLPALGAEAELEVPLVFTRGR
jgi:hypothetical protein